MSGQETFESIIGYVRMWHPDDSPPSVPSSVQPAHAHRTRLTRHPTCPARCLGQSLAALGIGQHQPATQSLVRVVLLLGSRHAHTLRPPVLKLPNHPLALPCCSLHSS
eukprot:4873101-Prymnesium_polylepis.1